MYTQMCIISLFVRVCVWLMSYKTGFDQPVVKWRQFTSYMAANGMSSSATSRSEMARDTMSRLDGVRRRRTTATAVTTSTLPMIVPTTRIPQATTINATCHSAYPPPSDTAETVLPVWLSKSVSGVDVALTAAVDGNCTTTMALTTISSQPNVISAL